ncbi:WhiB family transcriptional regulator [Vallicoccus soli]|uniref:Transcriptional regulator WhiB n=1 Tax=Vallicoccus soli TaxID=2339232 RepID=A0A3A3YTN8_9ACTN|nr:WhiB family transcriptional regulator [Vallicoccus soli]RJK94815.1 WhiB family transcriptional regulator [Vallicoccus soli]
MVPPEDLPGALLHAWDWQRDAACRDADPSLFFAADDERGHSRLRREAAAHAYCGRCPVAAACLRHALGVQEPYGVWGGMSEVDLRRATRPEGTARAVSAGARAPRAPRRPAAARPRPAP